MGVSIITSKLLLARIDSNSNKLKLIILKHIRLTIIQLAHQLIHDHLRAGLGQHHIISSLLFSRLIIDSSSIFILISLLLKRVRIMPITCTTRKNKKSQVPLTDMIPIIQLYFLMEEWVTIVLFSQVLSLVYCPRLLIALLAHKVSFLFIYVYSLKQLVEYWYNSQSGRSSSTSSC